MIFFRTHLVSFHFNSKEKQLLLFGKLKAFYSAPIDPLSGMTVNLKDVDEWMKKSISSAPEFKNTQEAVGYYYKALRKLSKDFAKLKIKIRSQSFEFDGNKMTYSYHTSTWFSLGKTWVQRPIRLETEKPISKAWLRKLAQLRWSAPEVLASKLPGTMVEVEFPERSCVRRFRV